MVNQPGLLIKLSFKWSFFFNLSVYLVNWALLPPLLGVWWGALGGVDDDDYRGCQHAQPGQPEEDEQTHPHLYPEWIISILHQFFLWQALNRNISFVHSQIRNILFLLFRNNVCFLKTKYYYTLLSWLFNNKEKQHLCLSCIHIQFIKMLKE